MFVQTDVADPASMAHLRRQAQTVFDRVDILINNAEANQMKLTVDHTVEEWDRVFAVNLRGAFLGIQLFLPEMLRRKDGVVITFESAEGMPFMSAYFASKVGLRSLAMSLAQEVGETSGVSVYCFGAGMVDTPAARAASERLGALYGLTPGEFILQSAPGGHLISAELCATGLAGTILHAKEFHGQEAYYALGLAKLGLDASGEPMNLEAADVPAEASTTPRELVGTHDGYQDALALNRRMEEIIRVNIREYDELSMFQRPIVKRMFQQGSGQKVEDWLASAQDMSRRLENATPVEPSVLNTYLAQLRRMAEFITKQENDARGWFRDPQQLNMALKGLAERKATVQKLEQALADLCGAPERR